MSDGKRTCAGIPDVAATRLGPMDRLARSLVLESLSRFDSGRVTVIDGERPLDFGEPGSSLRAAIRVHDPLFYRKVAFGGSIGGGEAYMDGLWDCDDLPMLARILVRNRGARVRMEGGAAWGALLVHRMLHWLNDNTLRGSRRNIRAHYDLGNDLFRLFLDPTMAYSCGIFEREDSTMEEASVAKFERVCRALRLGPETRLLEIGTGWGGFAIHAARKYGCHVTTTTISDEQHSLARERVKAAGLEGRITLLKEDYRKLAGEYDRLAAIEMIEAVGDRHLPAFFEACCRRLKRDGLALIQAITVPDREYAWYVKNPDFINRYIFPGGCCPSLGAMTAAAAGRTDFRLVRLEDFTPHYARTLREWRRNFHARLPEVRALGYDDRFVRMWDCYLAFCEGGFAEQHTGLLQLLYARPDYRVDGG